MRDDIVRHAGTIVAHADLKRQTDGVAVADGAETDARTKGRLERDLAIDSVAYGFCGIFNEIEERLNKEIAICK